jgi:hypothetical protein
MFQLGPFADTNGFMYRCKQTRGLDRRPKRPRKYAAELVALAPEVILAHSSAAVAPLLQATRTVPIVFTTVADPVGAGYIHRLVEILPRFSSKRQVVEISQQIESDISAYLVTITIMNAAVGIAMALAMRLTGVGDPILWGTVAFC